MWCMYVYPAHDTSIEHGHDSVTKPRTGELITSDLVIVSDTRDITQHVPVVRRVTTRGQYW